MTQREMIQREERRRPFVSDSKKRIFFLVLSVFGIIGYFLPYAVRMINYGYQHGVRTDMVNIIGAIGGLFKFTNPINYIYSGNPEAAALAPAGMKILSTLFAVTAILSVISIVFFIIIYFYSFSKKRLGAISALSGLGFVFLFSNYIMTQNLLALIKKSDGVQPFLKVTDIYFNVGFIIAISAFAGIFVLSLLFRMNTKTVNVMVSIVLALVFVFQIGATYFTYSLNAQVFAQSAEGNETSFFEKAMAFLGFKFAGNSEGVTESGDPLIPPQQLGKSMNILFVGEDAERLTDVMFVACFDLERNTINILQIPRDSSVGGRFGTTAKFNSVYKQPRSGQSNIDSLISEINKNFKLRIDHYITTTFDGFAKLIDAMGGIEINVLQRYMYDKGNGKPGYVEKGKQTLNGIQALGFIRYRAGFVEGDMGRVKMQRVFYAAFAKKLHDMGRQKLSGALPKIMPYITSDMSASYMLGVADRAYNVKMQDIKIFAASGEQIMYKKVSMYSIHKYVVYKMLNDYFRPYEAPVPADELDINELVKRADYSKEYDNITDDLESLANGENPITKKR